MKLLIIQFPPISRHFISRRTKVSCFTFQIRSLSYNRYSWSSSRRWSFKIIVFWEVTPCTLLDRYQSWSTSTKSNLYFDISFVTVMRKRAL
jgi:hypothetical protein